MAKKIELLSPAKNLECGIAAINHGADAVYVGASLFSARSAAGNSLSDIEKLCQYAHQYHAHVHVALNTILTDDELEVARKLIFQLYDVGIDALIIQDMGILELALPPIAIHASTQTDNRTVERIQFWEKIGLQRAILARELSLKQIAEIRQATQIELECFVHGALCVSYSGQCYMSQACVGRSANRGECAQFCRLPYSLLDADGKTIATHSHLLSLKDMNRSHSLRELMDAGITSFKIEGRLKNIDYVKNITAFYRQHLDRLLEQDTQFNKASSGKTTFNFTPQVAKTFTRGETEYFLHERENIMVTPDTSKSIGEPVGVITDIHQNSFQVNTSIDLHNGDGLSYINHEGNLQGFRINKIENHRIFTLKTIPELQAGMMLYRNYDTVFMQQLDGESAQRKIPLSLTLSETGKGFILWAEDEDHIQVQLNIDTPKEIAQNKEAAKNNLIRHLSKMGNTIFDVTQVKTETMHAYFFPVATINGWRREIVDLLLKARLQAHPRPMGCTTHNSPVNFPMGHDRSLAFTANIMNRKAEDFYLTHGAVKTAPAFEKAAPDEAVVMTCKHCIKYTLGHCSKTQKYPQESWKEPLYLQHGPFIFRLEFDCNRCEMKVIKTQKERADY